MATSKASAILRVSQTDWELLITQRFSTSIATPGRRWNVIWVLYELNSGLVVYDDFCFMLDAVRNYNFIAAL